MIVPVVAFGAFLFSAAEGGDWWPQFRGPNGSGVAAEGVRYPAEFGPTRNVVWRTALPSGVSSPCIWKDRIFLTGYDKKATKLETLCLGRGDGKILWRQPAPTAKIERVHRVSSPAAPTPATDGERVYVYFGSYGLLCYDFDGKEVWKHALPVPDARYGSGTSPVLAGDRLFLFCLGKESYLLAVDARTGKELWKNTKLRFGAGYASPVVRAQAGDAEVVVFGPAGVMAFDPKDGAERWWVGGMMAQAVPTPVLADGVLYVSAQVPGGDPDNRMKLPAFDDLLKKYDKDQDGQLTPAEIPRDVIIYSRGSPDGADDIRLKDVIGMADANKDGKISRFEWLAANTMASLISNSLVAVRPGGRGDAANSHVAWRQKLSLPEIPSPLVYQGRLYLIRNGGLLTCCDSKTGKTLYQERVGSTGQYYASPVAGDGKIYLVSTAGAVTVVRAGEKFEVAARNDLGESVMATPALLDGKIYLRTDSHLYAFGE